MSTSFLEVVRENPFPCLFQLLESFCSPGLMAPFRLQSLKLTVRYFSHCTTLILVLLLCLKKLHWAHLDTPGLFNSPLLCNIHMISENQDVDIFDWGTIIMPTKPDFLFCFVWFFLFVFKQRNGFALFIFLNENRSQKVRVKVGREAWRTLKQFRIRLMEVDLEKYIWI